jgi:hypothetical protein
MSKGLRNDGQNADLVGDEDCVDSQSVDTGLEALRCAQALLGATIARSSLESAAASLVEVLPELEHIGADELDGLEKAAVLIVRLRFVARRRAIARAAEAETRGHGRRTIA